MKNVLITGGNKGIGLKAAELFLKNGFHVFVIARDFTSFPLHGEPNVTEIPFDLAKTEQIASLIQKLPTMDVLINNAGMMYALPYDAYPPEKAEYILNVNLRSPVEFMIQVSKGMEKNGGGRIVNVSSVAALTGHPDLWYGITKAGLVNVTKSFAKLLAKKGIVTNAVAPGPAETNMLKTVPEDRRKELKANTYLNRFAYPEEVAQTIYWLATESPEYINGVLIDVDNGAVPSR